MEKTHIPGRTYRPFPRLSFFKGMTRVVGSGTRISRYRHLLSHPRLDAVALAADWYTISEDLRHAMQVFAEERHQTQ